MNQYLYASYINEITVVNIILLGTVLIGERLSKSMRILEGTGRHREAL